MLVRQACTASIKDRDITQVSDTDELDKGGKDKGGYNELLADEAVILLPMITPTVLRNLALGILLDMVWTTSRLQFVKDELELRPKFHLGIVHLFDH